MKNKKILVTGGEGFIGYHLCKKLIEIGAEVYSLDINLSNRHDRRVEFVEYVYGDTNNVFNLFKNKHFDFIFHLAEYSRVENSFEKIDIVSNSNIAGTAKILEFWRKQNENHKCKLIYAGSSTKFSDFFIKNDKDNNLNTENYNNFGNNFDTNFDNNVYYFDNKEISPYIFTKTINTELIRMYGIWYNIPYVITYFYNVYGEKENEVGDYATLIGIFKHKSETADQLPVVLPGTQKRNFTYVDDIISGLIIVAENGEGDNFGIGSDQEFSVLDVAKIFKEKFGNEIVFLPERKGNRMSSTLITSKIKALGWKCKTSLNDYINSLKK